MRDSNVSSRHLAFCVADIRIDQQLKRINLEGVFVNALGKSRRQLLDWRMWAMTQPRQMSIEIISPATESRYSLRSLV